MKKYLPLLENNVQWVVLGLGALYLLYMVYGNVLSAPASVEVDGQLLPPGKVDEAIVESVVNDLERRANSTSVPPSIPRTPPKPEIFGPATLSMASLTYTAFPDLSAPLKEASTGTGGDVPGGAPGAVVAQVTRLPRLGAATDIKAAFARASVDMSKPSADGAQPAVPPQGTDIEYVSVKFATPMKDIAREFNDTKIPPNLYTAFLKVELIRQEMDADEQWGQDTVVPPLKNVELSAYPGPNNPAAIQGYLTWAEASQQLIVQPPFYPVLKGQPWMIPGTATEQPGVEGWVWDENSIRPGFDPSNPPPNMTRAEKRKKYEYDVEKKREEQRQRAPQNRPPTGAPGGRPGGRPGPGGMPGFEGFNLPADSAKQDDGVRTYQAYPPRGPVGDEFMPGPAGYGPAGYGPGYIPGYNPGMPQGQTTAPCPTTAFDPRQPNTEAIGWAHDATVKPGRKYRYKIRYTMKNPCYGSQALTNPPELANQFDLVSADSAWSEVIEIPERTKYYIYQANPQNQTVTFDIFTYAEGQLTKGQFRLGAGDSVSGSKDNVSYDTGYTVVDVRPDRSGSDVIVVLADADGNLIRRSRKTDEFDANRKKLDQDVAAATSATTPPGAAPGAPGMPPPGAMGRPGMPPGF